MTHSSKHCYLVGVACICGVGTACLNQVGHFSFLHASYHDEKRKRQGIVEGGKLYGYRF